MALQFDDFEKMREVFQDEELDAERKQRQETQRRKLELAERKQALAERKQAQQEREQQRKEQQYQHNEKPKTGASLWVWTFCILGSMVLEFIVLLIVLLKY